jgi:hypothetical protein
MVAAHCVVTCGSARLIHQNKDVSNRKFIAVNLFYYLLLYIFKWPYWQGYHKPEMLNWKEGPILSSAAIASTSHKLVSTINK